MRGPPSCSGLPSMFTSLLKLPKVCALCGALDVRRPPLCRFCHKTFHSLIPRGGIQRIHGPLHTQSLFLWDEKSPPAFGLMASVLKQSVPEDWLIFAEWLLDRMPQPPSGGTAVVPAPARVWRAHDHAWNWARALSDIGGFKLCNPLVRVNTQAQKELSRSARSQIRIEVADSDWNCSDYKSVILVDDVLTTGSTAQACYRALGRPEGGIVWTLFDRAPCDAPAPLI
jgi:predicted amidophosphoribosyltransferase